MDNHNSIPNNYIFGSFSHAFPTAMDANATELQENTDSLPDPNRNEYTIPNISTAEYEHYINEKPINVKFQVRISKQTVISSNDHNVWLSETTRLWWAEYRNSFESFVTNGILPAFNISSGVLITGFTMIAKKEGRLIATVSFNANVDEWATAIQHLRQHGFGRNVDRGISSADTVLLLVKLSL